MLTPQGSKPIEDFQVGDLVLSRAENDELGPIEPKRIIRKFVRSSIILNIHVNGQLIRTTGEHPFHVFGKGWVDAVNLVEGDCLTSKNDRVHPIEAIFPTNEIQTVYNLEIEDYHTYFVGCQDWGFSVWAHNACYYIKEGVRRSVAAREVGLMLVPAILEQAGQPDKPIFAGIDKLYSPRTEIENDQRFQDILRDMGTAAGRASFMATGRIHVENLGEPGQSESIPLKDVKVK